VRILFLNPPFWTKISRASRWPEKTKSGTNYFPIWLCYAAGYAEKKGHTISVLDAIANGFSEDETIKKVLDFIPELIVMDTTTPTIVSDVKFLEKLKSQTNAKVCLVGTHVSTLPEETLNMSESIDFVARHEYELTIPELAKGITDRHFDNIPGISWRKQSKIIHNSNTKVFKNLDELPFVSKIYKRFLDIKHYRYSLARHPMVQVFFSRGCPNRCTFCTYPQTFSGRLYRTRTPENFVDELVWINNNLKPKEIFIEDDTFTVDKEKVLEICKLIKERGLKIRWSVNVRADLPYDIMVKMKDAGCRLLVVGYESGNQDVLNKIKKGITLEMSEKFATSAKNAKLKVFGCFMIGLPGDTEESIMQTFEFAKKLSPDMVFFQHAVPFPGTEFYNWVKEKGYLLVNSWDKWLDENGQLDFIVSYPNLSSEKIRRMKDKLFVKFYTSPKYIARAVATNLRPSEMFRMILAGRDFLAYLRRRKK